MNSRTIYLRRSQRRPWRLASWTVALAAALLGAQPPARGEAIGQEEPPWPLAVERTEATQDRLAALGFFAAARLKEHKGEPAAALRQYQRALRYGADPQAVWPRIVGLAFELDRTEEGIRYAVWAARRGPVEPALLRQLALYLTQAGDPRGALKFYEQLLADPTTSPADALRMRFEMGRLYFLEREPGRAADSLAEVFPALRDSSDNRLSAADRSALLEKPELTWRLFGEVFLAARRFDQAEAAFGLAQQAETNEPSRSFAAARIAHGRGRLDEARRQLEAYFATESADAGIEPYRLWLELSGDGLTAFDPLAELRRLHAQDARNPALAYYLGRRLIDAGHWDQARALLEPLAGPAPSADVLTALAETYRRLGDRQALVQLLGRALGAAGTLAALDEQVRTLAQDPQEVAALSAAADELAAGKPESLERPLRLALALLAIEAQQTDLAGRWFEAALADSTPEQAADLFLAWGVGLLLAERPTEAAAVFGRAIERNLPEPSGSMLRYQWAGALSLCGRTEEALREARRAAALRSRSVEFAARLPWVLYQAKRYDEAAGEFARLLARFDDQHDSPSVRESLRLARLTYSHAELLRDRVAQAEELLEQVLDEFPEDPGAQNDLAYLWADRGLHPQRALRLAQAAVAAEPENFAYRDTLGWALFKLGRHAEAIAELERAAALDPPDGVVLDHLGDAYQAAGRTEDARRIWQRAAERLDSAEEQGRLTEVQRKLGAL